MHRRILTLALVPNLGEPHPSVADSIPWVPMESFHFSPQKTAPTVMAICPNVLHVSVSQTCVRISTTWSHTEKGNGLRLLPNFRIKTKLLSVAYKALESGHFLLLCHLQPPTQSPATTQRQRSSFHFEQAVFFCLRAGARAFSHYLECPEPTPYTNGSFSSLGLRGKGHFKKAVLPTHLG